MPDFVHQTGRAPGQVGQRWANNILQMAKELAKSDEFLESIIGRYHPWGGYGNVPGLAKRVLCRFQNEADPKNEVGILYEQHLVLTYSIINENVSVRARSRTRSACVQLTVGPHFGAMALHGTEKGLNT